MFFQIPPPPPPVTQSPVPAPAPTPGQAPATPSPTTSPPPPPATPVAVVPVAPPPAATERVFAGTAGMIFNAIKPDSVKDFEMILGRLKQALAASSDPIRRQQAAGWKIFKATEPGPTASVLYVFVMDPAVTGADYGIAKILAEAFPVEAPALYRPYIATFASGQSLLNLQPAPAPDTVLRPVTVPAPAATTNP